MATAPLIQTAQIYRPQSSDEQAAMRNAIQQVQRGEYQFQGDSSGRTGTLRSADQINSNIYNSYSDRMLEHAEDTQKSASANPLQKAAAAAYLGVNKAASDYERMVAERNKYKVDFANGEKVKTGNDFNDFWMNVAGNIVLTPSAMARSVAAGAFAAVDKSDKSQVLSRFGESVVETAKDPEALTALALTSVASAGAAGAAARVAAKTPTKVIRTTGSSGRSITLKSTGGNTVTFTKKTTPSGSKLEITSEKNGGISRQIIREKEKTTTTDGNIVLSTDRKVTLIRGQKLAVGYREKSGRQTVIKRSNDGVITDKGFVSADKQTISTKFGKTGDLAIVRLDRKGNLQTREVIGKTVGKRETEARRVQGGKRARIDTRTNAASRTIREHIKNGESKKLTRSITESKEQRRVLDIDFNEPDKTLLTGKTSKRMQDGDIVVIRKSDLIEKDGHIGTSNTRTKSSQRKSRSTTIESVPGIGSKAKRDVRATSGRNAKTTRTYTEVKRPVKKTRKPESQPRPVQQNTKNSGNSGRKPNNTNTGKATGSGGMMYAARSEGKTAAAGTPKNSGAAVLLTKTAPKPKSAAVSGKTIRRGTILQVSKANKAKTAAAKQTLTPKTVTDDANTTASGRGAGQTSSRSSKTDEKKKKSLVVGVTSTAAVKPSQKRTQTPPQKQKPKQTSAVKSKRKTRARLLTDDDYTRKKNRTAPKKTKGAIRLETVNQFGWLGLDTSPKAKPKKIKA